MTHRINCCTLLAVCESLKLRPTRFPHSPDAPLCVEPVWTVCSLLDVQSHASLSWLLGRETCGREPQRSRLTAGVSGPVKATVGGIKAQLEWVREVWLHRHVCLSPCVAVPSPAHRGRRCSGCKERRSRLFSASASLRILLSWNLLSFVLLRHCALLLLFSHQPCSHRFLPWAAATPFNNSFLPAWRRNGGWSGIVGVCFPLCSHLNPPGSLRDTEMLLLDGCEANKNITGTHRRVPLALSGLFSGLRCFLCVCQPVEIWKKCTTDAFQMPSRAGEQKRQCSKTTEIIIIIKLCCMSPVCLFNLVLRSIWSALLFAEGEEVTGWAPNDILLGEKRLV